MKLEVTQEVLKKWGVYKITNIITGDFYIGSTIETFKKRVIYKHISDYFLWLNDDKKRAMCPILYNSFKKYGIENFKLEILFYFNKKKDSITNKKVVTFLESRFIKKLNPKYNICKFPEKSGCPNLGRKLDEEWKKKIGEKSKLYKHKNKLSVYESKSKQNKDLSSLYNVYNDKINFTGSFKECCEFLKVDGALFHNWYIGKIKCKKGYIIKKIKSQKKSIKIKKEDFEMTFNSFGECDRHLKMWKGFTSTQVVNKKDKILDFEYELL